ncbi:MAG: endonuclease/exonuclease/phosphatase family protein [Verrucomicrobiales bacterium]|nr:endonuclease/exonuclease/phosphatase family protein [Verrucomicrobiales bacterium]
MKLSPSTPPFLQKLSAIPAVFFCLFLSVSLPAQDKKPAKPEVEPLTFCFYNLKNYLAMDRKVDGETQVGAGKPEREIKPLIEALLDIQPDILGVCEIGSDEFLRDLQSRLKAGGIDLPHTELVRDAAGWDRNLALLSRHPIVARNSKDKLTYTIGELVMPHQRGILDVTVAPTETYRLRLVGLHFKSKREIEEADQALMRLNEAMLTRKHVDEILEAEPGANLLVFGDLNDTRNEPPIRTLQGRFGRHNYLSSLTLRDKYGFAWTHHWSWADNYSRLDFALLSKGISPEVSREDSHIYHWEDWDKASDHRPLVVKITPKDRVVK